MLYAKILVKGEVYSTRYFEFVREIAKAMDLNGIVRYCHGDVEIELEAKSDSEIEEFTRLIKKKKDNQSNIEVKSVAVVFKSATDGQKFIKFSIE